MGTSFSYAEFLQACQRELRSALAPLKNVQLKHWEQVAPLIFGVGQVVVATVEAKAIEFGGVSGAEKRRAVIDLLAPLVTVGGVSEELKRTLIGGIIDLIVGQINSTRGKKWTSEVVKVAKQVWGFIKKVF